MAKNVNLQVFRKTTKTYELQFQKNGAPKDITDWTIYFTVKEKVSDTDINAKINHNITSHQDAVNGKTIIDLTKEDTDRKGSYYYDICYRDNEGNVGVLYHGRIQFSEKVTTRA